MRNLRNDLRGLLLVWLVLSPVGGWAQNKLPAPSTVKLTDQEERGKGVFLQKCALCHLPKYQKRRTVSALAPALQDVLKKNKEVAVKGLIMKGSPNMPGFQYNLEPKQLDDLIAYLKTL